MSGGMETMTADLERELRGVWGSVAGVSEPVEEMAASPGAEAPARTTDAVSPLEEAAWRLWKPALLRWHAVAQRWAAQRQRTK